MKMTKRIALVLAAAVMCMGTGCKEKSMMDAEPSVTQMRSICNLAVMDCYYHNVAKFQQEVDGILWLKDEKHFWVEYSGVVEFGIDASYVNIEADDTRLTITIPAATVQDCRVDSSSLNEDSYIAAKDSAEITAEDEIAAFEQAQSILEEQARNDQTLLLQAQQRAQTLLENYINNLGEAVGKQYTIEWVYLNADGSPAGTGSTVPSAGAESGAEADSGV